MHLHNETFYVCICVIIIIIFIFVNNTAYNDHFNALFRCFRGKILPQTLNNYYKLLKIIFVLMKIKYTLILSYS